MLKSKIELEKYLEKQCDEIVTRNDICKAIYVYANNTYDIPKGLVSDYVTSRASLSEATSFELFILFDSICNVLDDKKVKNIDEFFTAQEIQYFKKSKYEVEEIKFPITFKMIQIEDDQWTGKIDIKTLMKLRKAQLINYNVNAQRTMQRIVRGDKEVYKITLNKKSVNEIASSYENNTFIPNAITLNIPLEVDSDFYYNEEKCTLTIRSLEHFDVTDGYHRYIAACQVSDLNPDFNYNMELRIVNFTEDKAKQFIFQQDQQNKMSKVDSDSMNMNDESNFVVKRLNENPSCNLKGLIGRNEGIISSGELAILVDYFYFKGVGKDNKIKIRTRAIKELTDNFNALTEYNNDYLEKRMDYGTLLVAMFCFDYFKNDDKTRMCEVIETVAQKMNSGDTRKFANKKPRKTLISEIERLVKEES